MADGEEVVNRCDGRRAACAARALVHHAGAQAQDEVQHAVLRDVVVRKSTAVLELPAREDEALLIRRIAPQFVDLLLDALDAVRLLHVHLEWILSRNPDDDPEVLLGWLGDDLGGLVRQGDRDGRLAVRVHDHGDGCHLGRCRFYYLFETYILNYFQFF